MIVIAGAGVYPELVVRGAKAAGVERVDVLAVRGSTSRATMRAADSVHMSGLGTILSSIRFVAGQGYDGAVLAGQINPLSLFRSRFEDEVKEWLRAMPCKNAHTIFGKLVAEFERVGVHMLPATCYMDGYLPGEGVLTMRAHPWRHRDRLLHVGGELGAPWRVRRHGETEGKGRLELLSC